MQATVSTMSAALSCRSNRPDGGNWADGTKRNHRSDGPDGSHRSDRSKMCIRDRDMMLAESIEDKRGRDEEAIEAFVERK